MFRTTLSESTARLKTMTKKLGSCIEKARPYFEAQELARTSQLDCQRAAVQYQRANGKSSFSIISREEECLLVCQPCGIWCVSWPTILFTRYHLQECILILDSGLAANCCPWNY